MARTTGKILITGMGAVAPVGVGVASYIAALREGRSGVRRLTIAEAGTRIKSTVAADVTRSLFEPEHTMDAADVARLPRLVPMAVAAAEEALKQAGLAERTRLSHDQSGPTNLVDRSRSRRMGVILGTGAGGIDFTMDQARAVYAEGGRGSLWTITNATHGNLAGELSIALGLRGPSWCVSTGCASAMDAVGMAMTRLRAEQDEDAELDGFVVVGADAHVRWETLAGMELLRVISTHTWDDPATASRPFDTSRDGFVLGEGAWAVVIEREDSWRRRVEAGTDVPPAPLGELLGYAATCDAFHRVRPSPDMEESAHAMRMAVKDARLSMNDVELIHYHGTATKINDSAETLAVKLAFGTHARTLRGTSVKSMIGHPQGACGLAALVATVGSLDAARPFVPPTINLHDPDIVGGCDLDYTPLRAADLDRQSRIAIINCLAFGAKNCALVVRAG